MGASQRVTYSQLHGLPVRAADGRQVGRVADVVVRPDGERMLVDRLLVARGAFGVLVARLRPGSRTFPVSIRQVADVARGEVRLRAGTHVNGSGGGGSAGA